MLTLSAGESSLVLAPDIGGAIVGWMHGSVPLLRRPHPEAILLRNARGLGCFPLVPFSNRIAWGQFHWNGGDHALERNLGDHPHSIHGVGWQAAWDVASVAATSAVLSLRHDAVGAQARHWPFAFAAEQRFTLTPDALHVVLTMTNLHADPAPAGLGLHPYFPRAGAPALQFNAVDVWLNGDDALPAGRIAVPPDWQHRSGKPIGVASLDNCFAGWNGRAQIAWADGRGTLAIEAGGLFSHLIVYTPLGQNFFCVEPVSHMTDAINRMNAVPDHGLHTLAPGGTVKGEVTFRLATGG